ncbi:MAG: NAD(P)/FAD-dependent oxidoreductase [Candidatus Aminicenantales bacterium]|jgi:all-trans-retinol 13,14-reductase
MKDALVIGAGFGGLVSALMLARDGLNVTIVEQNREAAPLLRNYSCQGFEVNNGFHYLGGYYPGGALHRIFDHLGLLDRLKPVALDRDGFDHFLGFLDDPITIPVGPARVRAALAEAFPGNEKALDAYFAELDRAFRDFDFLNLEEFFFRADAKLVGRTLYDFLTERGADSPMIEFLNAYSEMLLGVTAREVPFLTHLLGVGAYFLSAHTFEGGGGALAEALEKRVLECGVRIRTACRAVRIECDARRRFAGLRVRNADGEEEILRADVCVSTIHPKRLLSLLPDDPPFDLYARRVAGYRDTRAICIFHLAVDRGVAGRFAGNWHLFKRNGGPSPLHDITLLPDATRDPDPAASEIRMTALVVAWDNDKGEACPGGRDAVCLERDTAGTGGNGERTPAYVSGFRRRFTARLEAAFPEFRGAYRILAVIAPCDLDRLNATWNGSVYGLKCSFDRLGMTPMGPMKDLFLAGQSVVAPGIFGTLVSACLVSQRIHRRRTE